MIVNLDITYCPFSDQCELGGSCPYSLNPSLIKYAKDNYVQLKLMYTKPDCYVKLGQYNISNEEWFYSSPPDDEEDDLDGFIHSDDDQ